MLGSAPRRFAVAGNRGQDENRVLDRGHAVPMVREPTKFTYVQDDLTLIRSHLHPAAEYLHARRRRRIVFAESGAGDYRHQRLT